MKIINGDCLEEMRKMPENSVDSIVTDPPAGISFMGKEWDSNKGGRDNWIKWMEEVASECKRVLKPGGHALVWSIPRTSHWTATAWENAGFELRDIISHIFGTGFPKSLNVGIAVDKLQGNDREVVGVSNNEKDFRDIGKKVKEIEGIDKLSFGLIENAERKNLEITKGTSDWEGWGTALKPAREDWLLLRKPLEEKTVAKNVLKWGTGGINIDGCRIGTEERTYKGAGNSPQKTENRTKGDTGIGMLDGSGKDIKFAVKGRFPANLIHDGSEEVLELFPNSKGQQGDVKGNEQSHTGQNGIYNNYERVPFEKRDDSGSATRFFYCAKASKKDRNEGLDEFDEKQQDESRKEGNPGEDNPRNRGVNKVKNPHPTVKATKLMQYLVRLVTPKGGICLDPFLGSGSTGKACVMEGFDFIGIEKDEEYCKIAEARVNYPIEKEQVNIVNNRSLLDY